MSEWPSSKAKIVLLVLLRIGWSIKRETGGSHRILSRSGWPDYVFAFHDGDEIGSRMLARIAKKTGLKPTIKMPLSAIKSYTLVFVQFLSIGLILITGPVLPANIFLLTIELVGIVLGIWAILSMGIGRFNIIPDPKEGSHIVTRGPYRLIRHPMYLALLLFTLPLVIADFSWWRGLFWLALLIDLILKLNYEEALLEKKLDGYREYNKQRSYRLIPFIY